MRATLENFIHRSITVAEEALKKKDAADREVRMDWIKYFCA